MVVYKEHTMKTYETFMRTYFSNNFGISEDTVINDILNRAKNQPWSPFNRWHITKEQLKSKYIPFLKKHLNGGYVMFLEISSVEGGYQNHPEGANWINNRYTSFDPLQAMLDDIKHIKSYLYTYNNVVDRHAPEVRGDYVPDKPGEDTKVLTSCKKGTLGRYYMTNTMAGNAWVWGTKWCEANNVYFGNPYDTIIDVILKCGGKIDGKGGKAGSSSGHKIDSGTGVGDVAQSIIAELQDALKFDVHNISRTNYYENAFISLERTYNNTYKIRFRHDFIQNLVNNAVKNTNDHDPDNHKADDFNDNSVSSTKWWYPVINFKGYSDMFGFRQWRVAARQPASGFHDGCDISSSLFSDRYIYAVHKGTITYVGILPTTTWVTIIEKVGKYYVWYQEFSNTIGNSLVKQGDKVSGKQKIGVLNYTHLHIGVTKQSNPNIALSNWYKNNGCWLNPTKFLRKKWS